MNKYQKWLVVSIVFLAASFILPIYVLYTALNNTLTNAVTTVQNYYTSPAHATSGVSSFLKSQQAAQTQLLIVLVAVEVVLVACFAVSLWYAIKCRDQCLSFRPPV